MTTQNQAHETATKMIEIMTKVTENKQLTDAELNLGASFILKQDAKPMSLTANALPIVDPMTGRRSRALPAAVLVDRPKIIINAFASVDEVMESLNDSEKLGVLRTFAALEALDEGFAPMQGGLKKPFSASFLYGMAPLFWQKKGVAGSAIIATIGGKVSPILSIISRAKAGFRDHISKMAEVCNAGGGTLQDLPVPVRELANFDGFAAAEVVEAHTAAVDKAFKATIALAALSADAAKQRAIADKAQEDADSAPKAKQAAAAEAAAAANADAEAAEAAAADAAAAIEWRVHPAHADEADKPATAPKESKKALKRQGFWAAKFGG